MNIKDLNNQNIVWNAVICMIKTCPALHHFQVTGINPVTRNELTFAVELTTRKYNNQRIIYVSMENTLKYIQDELFKANESLS